MSRYENLNAFLLSSTEAQVILTFDELDRICA